MTSYHAGITPPYSSARKDNMDASASEDDTAELDNFKAEVDLLLSEPQEGPSTFAYGDSFAVSANPGLFLHGHGVIGLPLSDRDAELIISKSTELTPARAGRHSRAKDVCKIWELSSTDFTLKNPAWTDQMQMVLDQVYAGLRVSCGREHVAAALDKLLLYEQDTFSEPTVDEDKTSLKFGSLTICLPSAYEGGKLILNYDGEKVEYDTASNSEFGLSVNAWYTGVSSEVLQISSGCRLVLVYNLIRSPSAQPILSPRSNRDWAFKIGQMIGSYDLQSQANNEWPAFLIFRFDQKKCSVRLSSGVLKGHDDDAMRCLMKAAEAEPFKLYLAKVGYEYITQEYDDEEVESSYKLTEVTTPAGVQMCASLSVDYNNLLVDFEQGEWDESDHESDGDDYYGGRSYVTRRSENVAAIIVPASQRMKFLFEVDGDCSRTLTELERLMQETPRDTSWSNRFEQFCDLVVNHSVAYTYSPLGSNKVQRFQNLIEAIIDIDDASLFDKIVVKTPRDALLKAAPAMARAVICNGLNAAKPRIQKSQQVLAELDVKQAFLREIGEQMKDNKNDEDGKILAEFKDWRSSSKLEELSHMSIHKKNVSVPLDLCHDLSPEAIEKRLIPIIRQSMQTTRIAFINGFVSADIASLAPALQDFVSEEIQEIWHSFKLSNESSAKPENVLTGEDILQLIHHTLTHGTGFDKNLIFQKLTSAITSIELQTLEEVVMMLVQLLIAGNVPLLFKPGLQPSESCGTFVHNALIKYISIYVGSEPKTPKDWRQKPRGCGCSECKMVDKFLAHPVDRVLDVEANEKSRRHLAGQFFEPDDRFKMETIRNAPGRCHTWRLKKQKRGDPRAQKAWRTRVNETAVRLVNLAETGPLQMILGDEAYDSVMTAKAETQMPARPILISLETEDSISEHEAPVSTKRSIDDEDKENAVGKRQKLVDESIASATEKDVQIYIIDLT